MEDAVAGMGLGWGGGGGGSGGGEAMRGLCAEGSGTLAVF